MKPGLTFEIVGELTGSRCDEPGAEAAGCQTWEVAVPDGPTVRLWVPAEKAPEVRPPAYHWVRARGHVRRIEGRLVYQAESFRYLGASPAGEREWPTARQINEFRMYMAGAAERPDWI